MRIWTIIPTFVAVLLLVTLAGASDKAVEFVHVGPNWAALNALRAPGNSFPVSVRGETNLKLGENLRFLVKSAKEGKLWVVQVDPKDRISILVPNSHLRDNKIPANKAIAIPSDGSAFSIQATEPKGKSILCFIVTTGNTDLREALGSGKAIAKALTVVETAPAWSFRNVVVDVR